MSKIFAPFLLSLIFLRPVSAQPEPVTLTIEDKAQIIKSILQKEDLPNRKLIGSERREVIKLSLKNIAPEMVPKIKGINFVLLNQDQIQEQMNTGIVRYAFEHFKAIYSGVIVDFGYYFDDRKAKVSSSGGLIYEFKKIKGAWVGKAINGFGSTSE